MMIGTHAMRIGLPVLLAGLVLLGGCGQTRMPQDHYYRLSIAAPTRLAAPILTGTLVVKRFDADGLLLGRGIVHSRAGAPLEAEAYHYHHWTDIPPVMLQQQLVAYLRKAGIADHVAGDEPDIRPDYLITGNIHRFERSVDGSATGIIEIELDLIQMSSGRLLLNRTYRREVRAASSDMADTVAALNRGLSDIYAEFSRDITARSHGVGY